MNPKISRPLHIPGVVICGEDARTAAWRATVADAARAVALVDVDAVSLAFTLSPGRRADIDNLARPALEGLRDAGWFRRGFPSLHFIRATKAFGADIGLVIEGGEKTGFAVLSTSEPLEGRVGKPPHQINDISGVDEGHNGEIDFVATSTGKIPNEGAHAVKHAWRDTVAALWARPPLEGDVGVELAFNTRASLVGLLKANIDTLEPVLGRDPRGRNPFCPLDDKVTSLIARRTRGAAPALEVRVHLMMR